MPVTIIHKNRFHFGTGFDASRLPDGWKLKEDDFDWARGVAPNGAEYLLGIDCAWPIIHNRQNGPTIDLENPMTLNHPEDALKTRS